MHCPLSPPEYPVGVNTPPWLQGKNRNRAERGPVGDGKDGAVALGFDDSKETAHLLLGKVGDGAVLSAVGCWRWVLHN